MTTRLLLVFYTLFLASVKPQLFPELTGGKDDTVKNDPTEILLTENEGPFELKLPVQQHQSGSKPTGSKKSRIVAGLDQYYNNEWKKGKDSVLYRYHYTWLDTMDSGFSEFGVMFSREGAELDTLNTAPTDSSLQKFSIYIIVDPDTPKETAAPNYLEQKEIDVIERWVKNGGTLVLMGNDKGNSEFQHFNMLSKRFGIKFNEDMHQDVKNNLYDSGMVRTFPRHPAFENVRHTFIKQFSSLTVQQPAQQILNSRGVTVMAASAAGKGNVFAIGDPWLYNEYIDNRRLPAGYENYDAAAALVRWLCSISQKVR